MDAFCPNHKRDLLHRSIAGESIDLVCPGFRSFRAILFLAVCLGLSRPVTMPAAQFTIGVIGDYGAAYAKPAPGDTISRPTK